MQAANRVVGDVRPVAVVVLNWNQRQLTLDCLASLYGQTYPALDIILVDNGSQDGSAEAVRTAFPAVTVIQNEENLGFAEGNNIGIRHALQSRPDYVMLLNNDTLLDPDMVTRLVDVVQADPTVGIVGPKMLYDEHPDTIWCAGNRIDWRTGASFRLQAEERDESSAGLVQAVDFITACGILLRREVIETVGLLDPRFFLYYEETDWCARASAAGWRILYVPQARLWHKVSASSGASSPSTEYYMSRNVVLFLAKNRRGPGRLLSLSRAVATNLLIVLAYTLKPDHRQWLRRRNARLLALRDAILGRWSKMGPDVAAECTRQP